MKHNKKARGCYRKWKMEKGDKEKGGGGSKNKESASQEKKKAETGTGKIGKWCKAGSSGGEYRRGREII